MEKRTYLASPHMSDEGYEKEYIKEAFDKNWIAPVGENIDKLEEDLQKYLEVKAAIALNSGTSAIHMALKAAGVTKGDIVLCQSLTFIATVNPVIYQNAIPVFIDSEEQTYNMSPECLEKALEKYPNSKAVIVTHLYGTPAKMDEIVQICKKHNVPLIEDACESLGSLYREKYTGTFGDYAAFSFNGNKIITTGGGGALVTNNEEKAEKIRYWSTQAREKAIYYEHKEIGYNYRLGNIPAGIGRGQLKVLNKRIQKKKEIYELYKKEFERHSLIEIPTMSNDIQPNYWLSTLKLKNIDKVKPIDIINELAKNKIEARPIWKPMHMQPVFKNNVYISNPNKDISKDIYDKGMCLPSDTNMTIQEQQLVINIIKELIKNYV